MSSKYHIWIRGGPRFAPLGNDPKMAILAFVLACTRDDKLKQATNGFLFEKYKGVSVVEGYLAYSRDDVRLMAILYGATEEDWVKYGPPESIQLTKEELAERGLTPSQPERE